MTDRASITPNPVQSAPTLTLQPTEPAKPAWLRFIPLAIFAPALLITHFFVSWWAIANIDWPETQELSGGGYGLIILLVVYVPVSIIAVLIFTISLIPLHTITTPRGRILGFTIASLIISLFFAVPSILNPSLPYFFGLLPNQLNIFLPVSTSILLIIYTACCELPHIIKEHQLAQVADDRHL